MKGRGARVRIGVLNMEIAPVQRRKSKGAEKSQKCFVRLATFFIVCGAVRYGALM